MGCCGENRRRAAIRYPSVTRDAPPPDDRTGPESRLRFTGHSAILVRGPVSGRSYAFTKEKPEQAVARPDIEALLRTGLFVSA